MDIGTMGLYSRAPVWVQNVLVTLYGFRLRSLRYGGRHRSTLAELRVSQSWPADQLERMQMERLRALVRHAAETVPLYQGRLPRAPLESLTQLRDLPTLTKDALRAPREFITSRAYRAARLIEIHTGGTTGTPLSVYCDRAALQRNYAFFSRFKEWAGVADGERVATFAGRTIVPPEQRRPPYWRRNAAARTLLCSSYHLAPDTVAAYAAALAAFRPALIDSYPSSIEPIARHMIASGMSVPRPKAVITSSETLGDADRALIERAFACRVHDHYGAAEMAALITQCEAGSYHVNPEFGIVELLAGDTPVRPGEEGEIVATGFVNPVMPVIRYRTGDAAVLGEGQCRCGRAFPTVRRIEGRMDDVLVTPEGRRIGRLDPIFKAVRSIRETRIVQDAADHVRVELVPDGAFTSDDEAALRYELGNRLGPSMRIDIVQVADLPRTAAGKRRAVVNARATT